jgi:hypothetical protein
LSAPKSFLAQMRARAPPVRKKSRFGDALLYLFATLAFGGGAAYNLVLAATDVQHWGLGTLGVCAVCVPLIAVVLYLDWSFARSLFRPAPAADTALSWAGGPATQKDIEADFAGRPVSRSPLQVGDRWLCYVNRALAIAMRLDDLVWVYHDRALTGGGFVESMIVAWSRDGVGANLLMRRQDIEAGLQKIAAAAPWLAVGYSDAMKDSWNEDRAQLIELIDRARDSGVAFASAGPFRLGVLSAKPPEVSLRVRLAWLLGAVALLAAAGLVWLAFNHQAPS